MKKDVNGLINILKESINKKDDKTAGAVVIALLKLGPITVDPLIETLRKENNLFLKFLIIRILEKIRDKRAVNVLIELVENYYKNKWQLKKLKVEKPQLAEEASSIYFAALHALKKFGVTPDKINVKSLEDKEKLRTHYEKV